MQQTYARIKEGKLRIISKKCQMPKYKVANKNKVQSKSEVQIKSNVQTSNHESYVETCYG